MGAGRLGAVVRVGERVQTATARYDAQPTLVDVEDLATSVMAAHDARVRVTTYIAESGGETYWEVVLTW